MSCEHNDTELQIFSSLSTAELEQLLRLYADDAISMPEESVIAISEILAVRNLENGSIPHSPAESFDAFQKRLVKDPILINTPQEEHRANKRPTFKKIWQAACRTVAAILVVLLMGGFIPTVFGVENVFTLIGTWTDRVFSFLKDPQQEKTEKSLNDLRTIVRVMCDIDHVVPSWLPDNMRMVSLESTGDATCSSVLATFSDETRYVFLLYSTIYDNALVRYEKDDSEVEEYAINGQIYYIMNNEGKPFCTWAFNQSECQIWGDLTMEELYKIVNSISQEEQ